MPPWGRWRPKMWNKFRKTALAMDMTLRQNGDSEGCLSFGPANEEQAKLALRIAGVRPKRRLSPEQLARLATVGFKASRHTVEGHFSVQNEVVDPQVALAPIETESANLRTRTAHVARTGIAQ